MSGGSYDYAYRHIEQLADDIECRTKTPRTDGFDQMPPDVVVLRLRFVEHLRKVAQAAHDIEWVDSGDYGDGAEVEAIEAVLEGKR